MNTRNMRKKLICKICDFGFTNKYVLIDHLKCIHNVGSITKPECLFCRKLVTNPSHLEVHLRTHTKETPFFCNVCPHECSQKQHLQRHLKTHDTKRSKCFQCDLCPKRYHNDFDKKMHLKSHLLEKPHKCNECEKEFRTKQLLTIHILRIHRKETPFQCEVCQKGFIQRGDLTEHMRVHTGEKPFSCGFCDLKFSRSSSRLRHQKMKHEPIN